MLDVVGGPVHGVDDDVAALDCPRDGLFTVKPFLSHLDSHRRVECAESLGCRLSLGSVDVSLGIEDLAIEVVQFDLVEVNEQKLTDPMT